MVETLGPFHIHYPKTFSLIQLESYLNMCPPKLSEDFDEPKDSSSVQHQLWNVAE